jgi:hypothetical protein
MPKSLLRDEHTPSSEAKKLDAHSRLFTVYLGLRARITFLRVRIVRAYVYGVLICLSAHSPVPLSRVREEILPVPRQLLFALSCLVPFLQVRSHVRLVTFRLPGYLVSLSSPGLDLWVLTMIISIHYYLP